MHGRTGGMSEIIASHSLHLHLNEITAGFVEMIIEGHDGTVTKMVKSDTGVPELDCE